MKQTATLLIATLAASLTSNASWLLTINITNQEAVLLSATTNSPTIAEGTISNYNGISLIDFTNVDSFANGLVPSSTLTANGTANSYNEWWFDDFGTGPRDLNLYFSEAVDAALQDFTLGQPAFTGSMLLDLQAVTLPVIGSGGSIRAGDSTSSGAIIGSYTIVPEPSSFALLLGLLGLCLAATRRRKRF